MRKLGRSDAKSIVKFDVFGSVGEVVLPTDHVGELHFDIIDNIHKMKNPRSIGAADCHIGMRGWIRHVELNTTANNVLHKHTLARRAEADGAGILVNMAASFQAREVFGINVRTLALLIRAKWTALVRPFIPVDAQPIQAFVNDLTGLLGIAFLIGILDAENERAAVLAGVEPIEKRGARSSHVEVSGR